MNFQPAPGQELLRKAVREFAEREVAPLVEEMERTDEVPLDLIKKMGAQGYLGVTVPAEEGGTGLGHLARMILLEELGRVSAAMSMSLQCLQFGAGCVREFGSAGQKERYMRPLAKGEMLAAAAITEAGGGSDPAGIATEALDCGDHYLLNGRKVFITNSHIADLGVFIARTKDAPKKEFSAFLVEKGTPGFHPGRAEKKIGFHGCVTGELVLENCRVPKENLLGEEGQGLAIALKGVSDYGRTGIVGVALGLMQASLEAAVKFAGERVLYGKPISALPAVHFRIAEMYADLEASRLLAYRAAWLLDQGRRADTEIAATKFFATEAALRCARKAMDIHGAYGCIKGYAAERYCRDAQLLVPADGTNDIMRVVAGRSLTARRG
ncbi:MAG: acyl-CoA dehydrogenase family protein [Armatimonadetes bacterium]|nr:acyl-CoA dehydrogenase family protein [Armatimonadota bacterium]